jgi:glycosyltransferase involved in cell wall biosynthesis
MKKIAICNRNPADHYGGDLVQVWGYQEALRKLGYQVDYHWELFPNLNGYSYAILTHANLGWTDRQVQSVWAANIPYTVVAVWYPNLYSDTTQERVKELINRANKIVCFSKEESQEMITELELSQATQDKIVIVPNGVDKSIFNKDKKPGEERLPMSDFVMSAGRCDRLKQFHLVIEACKKLNLPVVIAASKWEQSYRDELKAIWNKAIVLDQLDQVELAKWYRSSKVYVCASQGERDNLGILEAAACGSSVVNTIHNRGKTNLSAPSVEPQDSTELELAIMEAYLHPKDYSSEVRNWSEIVQNVI